MHQAARLASPIAYICDQNTARQVENDDNLAVNGRTRQPCVGDQNTARQVEIGDNLAANGQTRLPCVGDQIAAISVDADW